MFVNTKGGKKGDFVLICNVKDLCKNKGITFAALERATGLSSGSLKKWGTNVPSVDKVKAVADYLGVTVDELLR